MALLLPALTWAQNVAPSAAQVDSATEKALVKLGGQLMVEGKAYEYDRKLADDIGPRLTGSDNYIKAAAWAVDEFKKMGLPERARGELGDYGGVGAGGVGDGGDS